MASFLEKIGFASPLNQDFYVYAPSEENSNECEMEDKQFELPEDAKPIDSSRVFIVDPKTYNPLNTIIGKIFLVIGIALPGIGLFLVSSKTALLSHLGIFLYTTGAISGLYGSRLTSYQNLAKLAQHGTLKQLSSKEKQLIAFAIFERTLILNIRSFFTFFSQVKAKFTQASSNNEILMQNLESIENEKIK